MNQRGIFEKVPGSGEWWIRYADATGRIRREKVGTKAGAVALYHKRKAEALAGRKLPERLRQRPVLFREIVEEAILDVKKRYRRPSDEVARLRLLVEWFGERPADAIQPGEIEARLRQESEDRGWAPSTINHHRSLMSLAYRLGRKVVPPKVTGNPARDVPHEKENNDRVRELRAEEEERLLRVIRSRFPEHEPEFQFARHTGLRQGIQYSLTWGMVDWEYRALHIPRTKNGSPLHVPLNEEAFAILQKLRAGSSAAGRVFCSGETGNPLGSPKHWFTTAVREAGIDDFHWHDLRHDFATRLRRAGVPLEDIADLLGHKTLAMTKRYAHISMDRLRDAVSHLTGERTDTRTDTKGSGESKGEVAYLN